MARPYRDLIKYLLENGIKLKGSRVPRSQEAAAKKLMQEFDKKYRPRPDNWDQIRKELNIPKK